jgi:hypothetical protein
MHPIFGISARIEIGAITAFPPGTLLPPKGECAEIAQGLERMRPGPHTRMPNAPPSGGIR